MKYCPVCKRKAEGRVCSFCGAVLELEEHYSLNPYEKKEETARLPQNLAEQKASAQPKKKKETRNEKKPLIIALCVVLVIIAVLVGVIISVSSDIRQEKEIARTKGTIEEMNSRGEKYMKSGNYEEAEELYKELMETTDDDEAEIIYKILYNYNMAKQHNTRLII